MHIKPFLFLMNACLLSTAFKSSPLFLIKTESILQTVKVDFFSDKLRPALDTLIGLGFEVASERFFFLGLAKVFFCFGVEFLLFIGSAVGVENSTQEVSGTSIALLRVSGGGSLGVAETSEKRRGVVDYMQYHLPSQRKVHVNGNLAEWMMLHAPPTSASLSWFYYNI